MPELGAPTTAMCQVQSWLRLAGEGRILVPVYCHMDQFLAYKSGGGNGQCLLFCYQNKGQIPTC